MLRRRVLTLILRFYIPILYHFSHVFIDWFIENARAKKECLAFSQRPAFSPAVANRCAGREAPPNGRSPAPAPRFLSSGNGSARVS